MTDASPTNLVEYACSNQVATLTLNRPDRLNAFSDDLVRHLADALRRFDLDPEAQVAIICGRGRAFSSGADVHQRQLRKREEFEEHGGPQGWGANSADLLTRSVSWKPVNGAQVWFTLKDTGKVQGFNAQPPFPLLKTLDTGPITNHVNIVRNANRM